MKKPPPSNAIINIFLAIAVLFGCFAIAAIINHMSNQFQQNEVQIEDSPL